MSTLLSLSLPLSFSPHPTVWVGAKEERGKSFGDAHLTRSTLAARSPTHAISDQVKECGSSSRIPESRVKTKLEDESTGIAREMRANLSDWAASQ